MLNPLITRSLPWIGALLLFLFIIADHSRSGPLDHVALEQWRASGAYQCAPCGQACTPPTADK